MDSFPVDASTVRASRARWWRWPAALLWLCSAPQSLFELKNRLLHPRPRP